MKVSYDQPKAHKTHAHYSVTMNRKVKEDSKEMSEKKPSDIST